MSPVGVQIHHPPLPLPKWTEMLQITLTDRELGAKQQHQQKLSVLPSSAASLHYVHPYPRGRVQPCGQIPFGVTRRANYLVSKYFRHPTSSRFNQRWEEIHYIAPMPHSSARLLPPNTFKFGQPSLSTQFAKSIIDPGMGGSCYLYADAQGGEGAIGQKMK